MSRFTKAWIIWTAVTLIGFGVIETLALMSGDMDNTLSAHLRLWLGLDPVRPWGIAGGAVMVAFCTWLAWHIVFDRDGKK